MKKVFGFLLLLSLLPALTGCCTATVHTEDGRTLCAIENTSWLCFYFLPLFASDPATPNGNGIVWFRDTATIENNMKVLDRQMALHDADGLKDLCSYWTEEKVFFFLFQRHTCHTSAELLKTTP